MNKPPCVTDRSIVQVAESAFALSAKSQRRLEPAERTSQATRSRGRPVIRPTRALTPGRARSGGAEDGVARTGERGVLALPRFDRSPSEAADCALSLVEAERHELARELHDETAQILTATLFQLDACVVQLGPEHRAVGLQLRSIRETLCTATREIHRLVYSLSPPVLADLGLGPALRWLVGNFQTRYQIEVMFKAPDMGRLPALLEAALFRIVQEALTNVARHAQARSVAVELRLTSRAVSCSIRDDGQGFDPQILLEPEKSRLGLTGMSERTSHFDGALTISSRLGLGTTVHVTIPLKAKDNGENTTADRRRPQDSAKRPQSAPRARS